MLPRERQWPAGGLHERVQKLLSLYLDRLDIRDRLETVVGSPQQDASKPQEIARYLEIDNLARPVRLDLVGTDPA